MVHAGLILTALLGWLLLPRKLEAGPAEGLSMGFCLGAFALSVELFFAGAARLPLNAWLALAPLLALAAWKLTRERPALRLGFHPAQAAAVGAAALALAVWAPYERAMPLTSQSWDAWAIWLFKAKAFYLDGSLSGYLDRTREFVGQPGYPLLTPLYATFLYGLAGEAADQSAKLLSPCFYLALLGSFHYVARRAANPLTAGIVTALLALVPVVQRVAFELAGYADTALSAYFALAAGFLILALRDGARWDWIAASLAATAAAWTKNEGQLFLLAFVALAAVGLLRGKRPAAEWAWLLAPPVVLLGAWSAVRSSHGVEAAGFSLLLDFHGDLFAVALRSLLRRAFSVSGFQLTFPLLLAGAAAGASLRAPWWFWAAPALAGAQFLGALLAYATGRNEIQWWLETSADRLLSQMAPLALLTAALAWGLWFAAASPPSPPVDPAEPVPVPAGGPARRSDAQSAKASKRRPRRAG
ncbi:MAG: hypothetical protein GC160_12260 [Acidobacteria bacterium]|nr:hypothetical protein [Acidobacteriota bacterium]